jgi:hypothetical protein
MKRAPSPNGSNGRDARGRFIEGNPGGPGNPHARRIAQLRSILLESISDDDFRYVVRRLVHLAKNGGELPWIKELFDRTIGKPSAVFEALDDEIAGDATNGPTIQDQMQAELERSDFLESESSRLADGGDMVE